MYYHHMGYGYAPGFGNELGLWGPWLPLFGFLLAVFLIWSLFWKGLALWHSARRGSAWWFVIMLLVNTAGILEIIYLFAVIKLKFADLFSNHRGHHS